MHSEVGVVYHRVIIVHALRRKICCCILCGHKTQMVVVLSLTTFDLTIGIQNLLLWWCQSH